MRRQRKHKNRRKGTKVWKRKNYFSGRSSRGDHANTLEALMCAGASRGR